MLNIDVNKLLNSNNSIKVNETSITDDIAIIGISLKTPQANNIEEFWEICSKGIECVSDFPETRKRDIDNYLNFIGKEDNEYIKGAYIDEIDKFDNKFFGLSPREASLMNPAQKLFLEKVWELIENAGYGGERIKGSKTGVYVGYINDVDANKYQEMIYEVENKVDPIAMTGNLSSMLPSRISYLLDLKGPTMIIDTACSSSLVAVNLACESIRKGVCDMAIAGGVRINLIPFKENTKIGIESSDGRTRPFDNDSDGTGLGEGIAIVLLKSLSQAKKDNDNIFAVIKGSAINQDGKSIGITAPNAVSQANVITDAWKDANVDPETITFIEAHGTGTKLGDPIEIDGIERAFSKYTNKKQFCAIGSVKGNIGHLYGAAGIAGLIKATLALKNRQIPPIVNFKAPNRNINFEDTSVYINDSLSEWVGGDSPRRCGVSSFGFSGTNCHVILEEAPSVASKSNTSSDENYIINLSAKSKNSLEMLLLKYKQFLSEKKEDIGDICYTANTGRGHYNYRLSLIVKSIDDLIFKVNKLVDTGISSFEDEGIYYGEHFVISEGKETKDANELYKYEKKNLCDNLLELVKHYTNNSKDLLTLQKISKLYTQGGDIDWINLYKEERKKVLIPAYQFDRVRCWLEIPETIRKSFVLKENVNNEVQLPSVKLLGRANDSYSDIEIRLGNIYGRQLGLKEIDVYIGFYELGGDSISLMDCVNKMKKEFNCDISFNSFINNSSINLASKLISAAMEKGQIVTPSVTYAQCESDTENLYEPFPLTDVQMAYFSGRDTRFELGGVGTYVYLEYKSSLDIELLNKSLSKLIKRHPMLHTRFLPEGRQAIMKDILDYNIEIEDISFLSPTEQEKCILETRRKLSHFVFDVEQWPLFNFKVFKLSDSLNYIFIGFDMLIADGTSLQIFGKELMYYYNNPNCELPKLDFTFRDYLIAYTQFKDSEVYLKDKEYWLSKLDSFPMSLSLPLKNDPTKIGTPYFKRYQKFINKDSWDKIKLIAKRKNLSGTSVLCTAYAEVLAFWGNQERFPINMTLFNRYPFNKDVNKLIGDFTSILLLEINIKQGVSFWEKASNIQKVIMEALEHRHYDGIEFTREISKANSTGMKAIMPIVFTSMLFNADNNSLDSLMELGELTYSLSQTPQVYIDNQAVEMNGGLLLTWDYVEQLFDEDVISAMFNQYVDIVSSLDSSEEHSVKVPLEDMKFIESYNNTYQEIQPTTLHEMFIEMAGKVPDNIAVEFEDRILTYRELHQKSNQVANYLVNNGIGRNDLVAVSAQRCPETIINILGILKSGAGYVPISQDYPQERKDYIVQNSKCRLMLDADLYVKEQLSSYSSEDIYYHNTEDVAYVIYTSGSTGNPKGVVITHKAVTNTIIDINGKFNITDKDRILGISSMCFDLSVYDIFGALSTGATLIMIPDQREVKYLKDAIKNKNITIWNSVPAIMGLLLENTHFNSNESNLRLVMLSGDWIPLDLPEKIRENFEKAEIISLGGATEASIWSIYYPVEKVELGWLSIPYGMPLANQKMYILNYNNDFCPIGVQGEIYIGGIGLAEGYVNNEEQTQKSFIIHEKLGPIYKTGDYGILHKEGYIEFIGRRDYQVKIRGYRIELGEIERHLLKHSAVKSAVVIDRTNQNGQKYLCAYIVQEKDIDITELREYLLKKVPEYMVPSQFVMIDKIPLTVNGKVDRKALPKPEGIICSGVPYKEPNTETEKKLAEIWGKLLGAEKVGCDDEFYVLGGDSLKATTLSQIIRRELGIEISLKDILDNSTLSGLAKFIDNGEQISNKLENNDLILLKKGTQANKNIFFIHSGTGDALTYTNFCSGIDDIFTCWGIEAEKSKSFGPKIITIEQIAKKYIKKIFKIQDEGAFCIAGWCTGGTIAFEIARQLEILGEEVKFVGLINSGVTVSSEDKMKLEFSIETERNLVNNLFNNPEITELANNIDDFSQLWDEIIQYAQNNGKENELLNQVKEYIHNNLKVVIPNFENTDLQSVIYYLNVIRTYERSDALYVPATKVEIPVSFFKPNEEKILDESIWNKYCEKPVNTYYLDGNHFSIFNIENVKGNSKVFNDVLMDFVNSDWRK